jgi:glycosyltransferase involved in cell wall biosynthesis
MRLLYTLTAYPPYLGGAQLHQHLLAQHLQQQHTIQTICHWQTNRTDWLLGTTLKAPAKSYDSTIDGIPVHQLGISFRQKLQMALFVCGYYPFMALALPAIARHFTQHLLPFATQSDLIHNVRIGREGLSYASLQVARQSDIPFIFTPVHHPRWVGWRYRQYLKLYTQADAVIALTQTEKQTLIQLGVSEDQIEVTGIGPVLAPQAWPEAFLRTHPQIQDPFVLFLGQHYLYKGYREVLAAAPLVWQTHPEVHFVFIGPAVKQSDQAFQDCDRRIHRLGSVDLQTKTEALAACTLLCVPSSQESFGGVYTEAWSFGKPVIGCNIPAVAEVISDGVDGYLVQQDPASIAEAIRHLLLNPGLAESMGQAGKNKVEEYFTWERLAQKTEQVYQSTLSGKSL